MKSESFNIKRGTNFNIKRGTALLLECVGSQGSPGLRKATNTKRKKKQINRKMNGSKPNDIRNRKKFI